MTNDLLSIFGIEEDDLKKINKKEKSSDKKKETSGGKKSSKKSSGTQYALPVKFCGGHLQHIFGAGESGKWSEDELKQNIREKFRELSGVYFKLKVIDLKEKEEGITTYVKPEIVFKEVDKDAELKFPLEVIAGEHTLWQDTEISLDEIRGLWIQAHPEYFGCKFMYDDKQNLLVPYMEANAPVGKEYTLPVTVGYLDVKETFEQDDFDEEELGEEELRQLYIKNHPEYEGCSFAYVESENLLFPIIKTEQEKDNKNISLPVEIRAAGFRVLVSPEDVKGKGHATLEELREVLEQEYPEYSKERTEMVYDKKHFVVPILKSSRKGIQIISERENFKHDIVEDENHCKWRVETRPFGIFKKNLTEDGTVEFELTAAKIPWSLVEETITLFRKNPLKEFAVQVFYDVKKETYYLYVPEQKANSASVVFQRNPEKENQDVLVMDIHSHGAFRAFFSDTDNEDEKGIRIYMVIGNLNAEHCTFKIRAGMAGSFGNMALSDIFHMQEGMLNEHKI